MMLEENEIKQIIDENCGIIKSILNKNYKEKSHNFRRMNKEQKNTINKSLTILLDLFNDMYSITKGNYLAGKPIVNGFLEGMINSSGIRRNSIDQKVISLFMWNLSFYIGYHTDNKEKE